MAHTSFRHSRMMVESREARQKPGLIGRPLVVTPGTEQSSPCKHKNKNGNTKRAKVGDVWGRPPRKCPPSVSSSERVNSHHRNMLFRGQRTLYCR